MLVWLLRSQVVQLQEVGARGAAIHALDHKTELAEVGALDLLVAHAKKPASLVSVFSEQAGPSHPKRCFRS